MVTQVAQRQRAAELPKQGLAATVSLHEVVGAGLRLEASAFNLDAHDAIAELRASGFPLAPLYGHDGFCQEAHNAFRFKRVYVAPEYGVPLLSSSDIILLRPETDRFLSRQLTPRLDDLIVRKWDVLISCSGTIGNVALAGDRIARMALSQDAIRARTASAEKAGFVTAFLRSRYGRLQLTQATYGSVITHIEPEHLVRVLVPQFDPVQQAAIGRPMCEACEDRDFANDLLDEADLLLHDRLGLQRIDSLVRDSKPKAVIVRASELEGRLDAAFHDPAAHTALKQIHALPFEVAELGDVVDELRVVTKFRKRVYVPDRGIPMLNSKQLFQIAPIDRKSLARGAHVGDLPEIALHEGMVAVTCSGTVGRVQIIPAYMDGWTASQDALRLIASEEVNAGYLYAWLASDYGQQLLRRHTYGSLIVHIDRDMLSSVPVPLPSPAVRDEVGGLVLKANALRDRAWRREQEAISQIEAGIRG